MSLKEIQQELGRLSSDPQKALFLQQFFKTGTGGYGEGDLFRGVSVPALRSVSKKYAQTTLPEAEQLLRSPYHEDRLLDLFILVRLYTRSDGATRAEIYDSYLTQK